MAKQSSLLMTRVFITSLVVIISSAGASAAKGRAASVLHTVESGQSLWSISRAYGCSVADLQEANELDATLIQPGQKLTIPSCSDDSPARASETKGESASEDESTGEDESSELMYQVIEGDTLGRIARRHDTTVEDLRQRNQLEGSLIRPGQKLRVAVGREGEGRALPGQSVGSPSEGELQNAMQLPPGRGYYLRRPHRAFGASHTIHHIQRAVAVVRERFPEVHELAIGDISAREGGPLAQHKSHQSGRDADIGLYFKKRPEGYPLSFVRATESTLDIAATWALIEAFADTADSASGVEKIFLNYELQEVIYEWARENGVSERKLEDIFQYPHGQFAQQGIVRHESGHDSHVHVRFKCPRDDEGCR